MVLKVTLAPVGAKGNLGLVVGPLVESKHLTVHLPALQPGGDRRSQSDFCQGAYRLPGREDRVHIPWWLMDTGIGQEAGGPTVGLAHPMVDG